MFALHPGVRKPSPLARSHADFPTSEWTHAPIGYAGGQWNLYAYCDNDPVNYTDRTGMYGENVHFYGTYMIASLVGYNDPHKLAYYTELPDEDADFEAIPNSVGATQAQMNELRAKLAKRFANDKKKIEDYIQRTQTESEFSKDINNYLHSLCGDEVVGRRDIIAELLHEKLRNKEANPNSVQDWEIGFLNHALGDSYAHATKGPAFGLQDEGGFDWRWGHTLYGHTPDIIKGINPITEKYKEEKLKEYFTKLAKTLNPTFNTDDKKFQDALTEIHSAAIKNNPGASSAKETANLSKFARDNYANQQGPDALKLFDSYQPEKSDREVLESRYKTPSKDEVRKLLDEIKAKCKSRTPVR